MFSKRLIICSIIQSSPDVTNVSLDNDFFSVSATQRLSMLNPLAVNNPAIRAKTPGSLSTSIDITCLNISTPLNQLI